MAANVDDVIDGIISDLVDGYQMARLMQSLLSMTLTQKTLLILKI